MSLTADQITAKNFEEYHKRILPFLNGSFPTPIVNKFSKGDLYSTDEKIVGQWIDGKPVYQKVIDTNILRQSSKKYIRHNIQNIGDYKRVVSVMFPISNNIYSPCRVSSNDAFQSLINDSEIEFTITDSWASNFTRAIVIVQYTKTTDSPISIGDGNDYSTDEQVVGTWIDGKPVYQKTIEFTQTLPAGNATTVAHGVTNLDVPTCFIVNGSLHTTGGYVTPFPTISSLTASLVGVQSITESALNVSVGSNYTGTWTINGGVFTLQYTKTTD